MTSSFKCPWLPYPESFFFWLIDWLADFLLSCTSSSSSNSGSVSLARTWSRKDKTCCCSSWASSSASAVASVAASEALILQKIGKDKDGFPRETFLYISSCSWAATTSSLSKLSQLVLVEVELEELDLLSLFRWPAGVTVNRPASVVGRTTCELVSLSSSPSSPILNTAAGMDLRRCLQMKALPFRYTSRPSLRGLKCQ